MHTSTIQLPESEFRTVDYRCQYCGKPGTAQVHRQADEHMFNVFYKMLACNPCADYRSEKSRLAEDIEGICVRLLISRRQARGNRKATEELPKAEEKTRKLLVQLTRSFAVVVCNWFNKPVTWEPDFVDMLIEQPWKHETILKAYAHGIENN